MQTQTSLAKTFYAAFKAEKGGDKGLDQYIEKIALLENLSTEEAADAMRIIMSGNASQSRQAAFLTAMNVKGPTADELAEFARTLRRLAQPIKVQSSSGAGGLGDTCGTGGGTLDTFNVSTTIMFILASAGIKIAKHGNRAITSKCGSADVLEELGIDINASSDRVQKCIEEIGIGFIYAPSFHKAFKNVQEVRKQIKVPTVFNILGPLANPAFSRENDDYSQVLGVNKPELTETMAETLKRLHVKRAVVVYGYNGHEKKGMDEFSTVGKSKVSEVCADGSIKNYFITPEQFGLKRANPADLVGGTAAENAKILRDLLEGKDKGPKRDLVLLNAAAGLYVGEKAMTIKDGIKKAKDEIDSNRAACKLKELIDFFN